MHVQGRVIFWRSLSQIISKPVFQQDRFSWRTLNLSIDFCWFVFLLNNLQKKNCKVRKRSIFWSAGPKLWAKHEVDNHCLVINYIALRHVIHIIIMHCFYILLFAFRDTSLSVDYIYEVSTSSNIIIIYFLVC